MQNYQWEFVRFALDVGGLTAVTLESPNVQGVTESVEHYVETFEGLEGGAHAFDVSGIDPRSPMAIDLWLKPRDLAVDQTIFDSLAGPYTAAADCCSPSVFWDCSSLPVRPHHRS